MGLECSTRQHKLTGGGSRTRQPTTWTRQPTRQGMDGLQDQGQGQTDCVGGSKAALPLLSRLPSLSPRIPPTAWVCILWSFFPSWPLPSPPAPPCPKKWERNHAGHPVAWGTSLSFQAESPGTQNFPSPAKKPLAPRNLKLERIRTPGCRQAASTQRQQSDGRLGPKAARRADPESGQAWNLNGGPRPAPTRTGGRGLAGRRNASRPWGQGPWPRAFLRRIGPRPCPRAMSWPRPSLRDASSDDHVTHATEGRPRFREHLCAEPAHVASSVRLASSCRLRARGAFDLALPLLSGGLHSSLLLSRRDPRPIDTPGTVVRGRSATGVHPGPGEGLSAASSAGRAGRRQAGDCGKTWCLVLNAGAEVWVCCDSTRAAINMTRGAARVTAGGKAAVSRTTRKDFYALARRGRKIPGQTRRRAAPLAGGMRRHGLSRWAVEKMAQVCGWRGVCRHDDAHERQTQTTWPAHVAERYSVRQSRLASSGEDAPTGLYKSRASRAFLCELVHVGCTIQRIGTKNHDVCSLVSICEWKNMPIPFKTKLSSFTWF